MNVQFPGIFSALEGMDWTQFIKTRKPEQYSNACSGKIFTIPALVDDISLSLNVYNVSQHESDVNLLEKSNPYPEIFSWRLGWSIQTNPLIEKKKKFISKPVDQFLCGSSWAFSSAGAIGDGFVITDKLYGHTLYSPQLSPTWILTLYPQSQCGGGSVTKLIEYLSESQKGIADSECIDYSWCATDPVCNPKAGSNMYVSTSRIGYINKTIPTKGCYKSGKHLMYNVAKDPIPTTVTIGKGGVTINNIQKHVKTHIYNNAPVIGSFVVLANFPSGDFTNGVLQSNGIYFERGVYTDSTIKFAAQLPAVAGAHTVSVIGWGSMEVLAPDINAIGCINTDRAGNVITKRQTVPYWYCRNSWGEDWGHDGGYFKMAMFPHNQYSQFDSLVSMPGPTGTDICARNMDISNEASHVGGGFCLFYVNQFPLEVDTSSIQHLPKGALLKNTEYYSSDKNNTRLASIIIVAIILGIIVLSVILFVLYSNKKRK
jgi:hypothetical protein